jgi:SAM-dependent methyltransferase
VLTASQAIRIALCRLCGAPIDRLVADLGKTPLANSYLHTEELTRLEPTYPLRALFCCACFLVQLEFLADRKAIFGSAYAYFSSYSATLLEHSASYADTITARLNLKPGDRVVEIGSNDGYLLRYFAEKRADVLGIEPAASVAAAAERLGIPTAVRFFGTDVASELVSSGHRARLLVANNVVAHVPDLNDFLAGLQILLEPGGLATLEFHHLLALVTHRQFDTIYHEHFQYFSLAAAQYALARHGLTIVHVEELPTQGGSLRVYARHADDRSEAVSPRVAELLAREKTAGLLDGSGFAALGEQMADVKHQLLSFLTSARQSGRTVVCYGAAAKGNTLLNYCGVGADLVDYAVDRNPHKQGLFLPGSHIPIRHPDMVAETKPDYLLLLPWNLRAEIIEQMSHIRSWGGRFVVPIPTLDIVA